MLSRALLPFFYICQSDVVIDTKLTARFGAAILHVKNKNVVPTIGWPEMMSEGRHVRAILMQDKVLPESLSWTQFLSFNQYLFMI